MLARKIMRPAGLALLLMVLLLAFTLSAQALENDPVKFDIQADQTEMTKPGKVKVKLQVSNLSDTDLRFPVQLYDPDGKIVGDFGDGGARHLSAGESYLWDGTWDVTEDQLDLGQFAYKLVYFLTDETEELVECSREAIVRLKFTGDRVKLTVKRVIEPEVVRSGESVTVKYELLNSGNVDLANISVDEKIPGNTKTVKALAAGESTTLTFTTKIGKADLVSNATIKYTDKKSNKSHTDKVEDLIIPLAAPNLKIELSSPTMSVNIGEKATLVVTFINEGNVSYKDVTVKDDKRGEILNGITIPAKTTVTAEKEFILTEPATFKIKATLPDNTGVAPKTLSATEATNGLTISVFDPEKEIRLTLNLTADSDTIATVPGNVKMTVNVTNNSNVKAEGIDLYHGKGDIKTFITTISALEPGASIAVTRDYTISQAGQFRFTAIVKDSMKNEVSFDSDTLQIRYVRPTAAPTARKLVTTSPFPHVTEPPIDPIMSASKDALTVVLFVLGGIFAVFFALFMVSTVVRLGKKSKSASAFDHLETSKRRDYTEPSDEEMDEVPVEDAAQEEAEKPRQPLPHERLVPSADAQMEALPTRDRMPATDGEGGYRVRRTAEPPSTDETAAPEKTAEASPRRRSSARTEDGEE